MVYKTNLKPYLGKRVYSQDKNLSTIADVVASFFEYTDALTDNNGNFWTTALNPDKTPVLDWAKQFWGGNYAWNRGTLPHIKQTIKPLLSNSKKVDIKENVGGYKVEVITYKTETDNDAKIKLKLKEIEPAGYKYIHLVKDGWTWGHLAQTPLTWGDVKRLTVDELKHIVPDTPLSKIEELYD